MSEVLKIQFKKRSRYVSLGRGLYQDPASGAFYERPYVDGRQTWRKLSATTQRQAEIELGRKRSEQARAKIGLAIDPYKKSSFTPFSEIAEFFLKAKCPKRDEQPRTGKQLDETETAVAKLQNFFGKSAANEISLESCRKYRAWRMPQITRGAGDRTIDIELQILSSIFRWAMRNPKATGITANPVAHDRPKFCRAEQVRHCRDFQPKDGDELHALASYFFDSRPSEVFGWQLLLEAMIGQRTHEILQLRWDAANDKEPGFISGRHLFLYRSATHKGTYPFIELKKPLSDCLEAFRCWHGLRYPAPKGSASGLQSACGASRIEVQGRSPWWFPSPVHTGEAVQTSGLTRALRRATAALGLPRRTSHGLRSYCVNVLRSRGMPDAEIALRIGHKSGGKLIVQVYGEILPYKLSWLPSEGTDPAWVRWLPGYRAPATQLELGL